MGSNNENEAWINPAEKGKRRKQHTHTNRIIAASSRPRRMKTTNKKRNHVLWLVKISEADEKKKKVEHGGCWHEEEE